MRCITSHPGKCKKHSHVDAQSVQYFEASTNGRAGIFSVLLIMFIDTNVKDNFFKQRFFEIFFLDTAFIPF